MGARSRTKGKVGEREVVTLLREHGIRASRGAPMQAAQGAHRLPDVVVDGPFWLEVKRGKRVNVRAALAQALEQQRPGDTAVVLHRDDNGGWCATARLEDILEIVTTVLERTELLDRRAPA